MNGDLLQVILEEEKDVQRAGFIVGLLYSKPVGVSGRFEQSNTPYEEIELTICYSKYLEISGIFLIWVMLIDFSAFLHILLFVDILSYLASNVCNWILYFFCQLTYTPSNNLYVIPLSYLPD